MYHVAFVLGRHLARFGSSSQKVAFVWYNSHVMKKIKQTTEVKSSMGSTNKYELVVIYPVSENEVGVEKQITEKCKKRALKVVSVDKWGTKTMAYEIKKQSRGHYLKLSLEGAATGAKELERDLQMDDKLLRFLLIRI